MKKYKYSIILIFIFACNIAHCQISFEYTYDNAGNRISRTVITLSETRMTDNDSINHRGIYPGGEDIYSDITGIYDQNENTRMALEDVIIDIYPNPVQGELNLEVKGTGNFEKVFFEVVDLNGRMISNNRLKSSNASINFSGMQQGEYILRLFVNDSYREYKVIKN
ncbi:MAG: T9SS type A sorting domain-containing protein [Bacteroidales bacterium]|jgi:hypothetical protein|nr:T9SS type A sorting domain-containing protein [Bacteroidales bacterium]